MDDVIPGRDGPEEVEDFEKESVEIGPLRWELSFLLLRQSWILTIERCSWVFRISTDRDLKHHKMHCAWDGVSIVWLA